MSVASRPVLEIQVKRTIAFTSTDKGFRSVVDQIVLTSRKPEVMPQKKLSAKLARSPVRGDLSEARFWPINKRDRSVATKRVSRYQLENNNKQPSNTVI
jgi:hypothetical protein